MSKTRATQPISQVIYWVASFCKRRVWVWRCLPHPLSPCPQFRGTRAHHLDASQSWKALEELVGVTRVTPVSLSESSILPSIAFKWLQKERWLFASIRKGSVRSSLKKIATFVNQQSSNLVISMVQCKTLLHSEVILVLLTHFTPWKRTTVLLLAFAYYQRSYYWDTLVSHLMSQ